VRIYSSHPFKAIDYPKKHSVRRHQSIIDCHSIEVVIILSAELDTIIITRTYEGDPSKTSRACSVVNRHRIYL